MLGGVVNELFVFHSVFLCPNQFYTEFSYRNVHVRVFLLVW